MYACRHKSRHDLNSLNFRHSLHMTVISRQFLVIIRVHLETAVISQNSITLIKHIRQPAIYLDFIVHIEKLKLTFHFCKLLNCIISHFLRNKWIFCKALHRLDTFRKLCLCLVNVLLRAVVDDTVDHVVIIFKLHLHIGKGFNIQLICKFSDLSTVKRFDLLCRLNSTLSKCRHINIAFLNHFTELISGQLHRSIELIIDLLLIVCFRTGKFHDLIIKC